MQLRDGPANSLIHCPTRWEETSASCPVFGVSIDKLAFIRGFRLTGKIPLPRSSSKY